MILYIYIYIEGERERRTLYSIISYELDLSSKDTHKKYLIYATINMLIHYNNKLSENYNLFNPLIEHSY